jgi:diguanylate cyclase (GGDEF)-like protein/PAS domain S-box-containing protein
MIKKGKTTSKKRIERPQQKRMPSSNPEMDSPSGEKDQDLYRTLIETVPLPLFYRDAYGRYIACNRAFERMLNLLPSEIIGKNNHDLFPVKWADKELVRDQELIISLNRQQYEWHFDEPLGGMKDIYVDKAPAIDAAGNIIGIAGAISDISERRALEKNFEESTNRLESLLNALPVAIVIIDHNTKKVIDLNPQAMVILGYTREQLAGRNCKHFICGGTSHRCPLYDAKAKLERSEGSVIDVTGNHIPVLKSVILTEIDNTKLILECFSDISEQKALENQLREMAETDFLTGLFNRRHFIERTEKEVSRSKRYDHPLSMIILDIDYFKSINDRFGHAAGDKVLKGIGQICQEAVRDTDFVGRIGGEEFAVVLIEGNLEGAYMVAERIRCRVASHAFQFEGKTIQCTISTGTSELIPQEDDLERLMKRADDALYRAKQAGRDQTCRG